MPVCFVLRPQRLKHRFIHNKSKSTKIPNAMTTNKKQRKSQTLFLELLKSPRKKNTKKKNKKLVRPKIINHLKHIIIYIFKKKKKTSAKPGIALSNVWNQNTNVLPPTERYWRAWALASGLVAKTPKGCFLFGLSLWVLGYKSQKTKTFFFVYSKWTHRN